MKNLQRTQHIAHREHWCDVCCFYILPGDSYERLVQLYDDPRRILVLKQHVMPEYPEDPQEPDSCEVEVRQAA